MQIKGGDAEEGVEDVNSIRGDAGDQDGDCMDGMIGEGDYDVGNEVKKKKKKDHRKYAEIRLYIHSRDKIILSNHN